MNNSYDYETTVQMFLSFTQSVVDDYITHSKTDRQVIQSVNNQVDHNNRVLSDQI
jgi:hypothetical protein